MKIELTKKEKSYIKQKINSGEYESETAVIEAGLRSLQEEDLSRTHDEISNGIQEKMGKGE